MLEEIKKKNRVAFYFSVGTVLISFLGFGAVLEEYGILPHNIFIVCLIAGVIILLFLYIIIPVVVAIINAIRGSLYINAQLKGFKSAEESIYLSIHSLNSEAKNYKYKIFNNTLEKAKKRKIDVKVLAPCGFKRIHGAYELCIEHKLFDNIRFNPQLEDKNLRFSLIDDNVVLVSNQKIPTEKLSRKYANIKSERLNELLKKYFEELWSKETTLDFYQYLKIILDEFGTTEADPTSIKIFSDRTGIPIDFLKHFLHQEAERKKLSVVSMEQNEITRKRKGRLERRNTLLGRVYSKVNTK